MTWLAAKALLGGLWAFLRSPLGQLLALALCAVLGLSLADARGYRRGSADVQAKWTAEKVADAETARRLAARNAVVTADVGAKVEARQAAVRVVTETLIREVPKYVTVQADARCDVPAGFIRLHDRAAAGVATPEPPGFAPDAASGLALSTVAETVADNYGACNANTEALKGWQEWWRRVSVP